VEPSKRRELEKKLTEMTQPKNPHDRRQSLHIRRARKSDHEAIWQIFRAVVAEGDSYVFDPRISRSRALSYWFGAMTRCYVALLDHRVVGTYILKPNQPGLGSHVANAGFMVAPSVQGRGIGRIMAQHCLGEAERLGFHAMQFNFVVSTNKPALRLWKDLGFRIVGRLPRAFRHAAYGLVDVYVMYRQLSPGISLVRPVAQ
jgi:L-amino acid N-acyltransferase YncA